MNQKTVACIFSISFLLSLGALHAETPKVGDDLQKPSKAPADQAKSDESKQSQNEVLKPIPEDLGIIVTCQPTSLFVIENGVQRVICRLPACTVLQFDSERVNAGYTGYFWPVWFEFKRASRVQGFVPPAHVFSIEEMKQRVLASLPDDTGREELDVDATVPRVVMVSEVQIVKAWKEVALLVARNGKISADKRSPEPHLALAHLWVAVGSHDDALREFVNGSKLIREQKKGDLLAYAKYFTVLEESLLQATKQPGIPVVAEGRRYWSFGMADVRNGHLDRAVFKFTDAVRLAPSEPVNWFSRALVYRALGLNAEAERDARIGTTIEQRLAKDPKNNHKYIRTAFDLETFQGSHRMWLEELRKGDGISWQRQY